MTDVSEFEHGPNKYAYLFLIYIYFECCGYGDKITELLDNSK